MCFELSFTLLIFTARCYSQRGIAKASCLSVCLSVRLSVCINVEVSWSYRLEFLENNSTAD